MKKRISLAIISCCFAASNFANAQDSQTTTYLHPKLFEILIGNSLVVVNKITPAIFHFSSDGTFAGKNHEEMVSNTGRWRVMDVNTLCMTVTHLHFNPEPEVKDPTEFCMELGGNKLWATWSSYDKKKGNILYQLVEGHPQLVDAVKDFRKKGLQQ